MDRLIDEVRARPVLWNSNLESYRDAKLKETTWSDVAAVLLKPRKFTAYS